MRRKPRKIYHAYRGKSRWRILPWVLGATALALLAALAVWLLTGGDLSALPLPGR